MQNLPIITTAQPAAPAPTPSSADNNAAPATESFGNVLARQCANTNESKPDTGAGDKVQNQSAAPASSTDSAANAAGNEQDTPTIDVANTLPGDMLAALLPTTTGITGVAANEKTNEKPVPQAPAPDGVSTLPSDMLAALLSTPIYATQQQPAGADVRIGTQQQPAATDVQIGAQQQPAMPDVQIGVQQQSAMPDIQQIATQQQPAMPDVQIGAQQPAMSDVQQIATQQQPAMPVVQVGAQQQPVIADVRIDAQQQPAMPDVRKGTRQQLIATGVQNGAGQPIGEQTSTSLPGARNNTPAATDVTQGKSFFTALKEFSENAAKTALSADTARTSAPAALPDATTLASITQSAASYVSVAASSNMPVQAAVVTPVTHDGWGDEFNQKVTWLATQHEQTAELHLNPPHLGPLDVVLNISGDQATALFTSPHAAVREAVEQAMPKLREMLADNGITLGNAMVNDQSPKEQQAGQADKQRSGNGGLSGQAGDAVSASSVALPVRRHLGMVDTFA